MDRRNFRHQRLTDQSVALVVERYALAAGLDPDQFAGHSLRRACPPAPPSAG
jgi:site-specific recombinase XerD